MSQARITPRDAQYYAVPGWVDDPLLDDVTRFAAARLCLGAGALMRRFRIGAPRARYLMMALDERRLLLSYLRGGRVARVNPHAWGALYAYGRVEYVTNPGESVMGIAARNLKDARRWQEIRDINAASFPDMGPHDYYPVGTKLRLPGR
ncbi:hypothetical protein [Pseudomonas sp. MWU12-2345]|uniref:hypothetical protein n=1 Tax=Pseudomonas sp. MWU12-2345 TaxID=2928689 RepID=UPI0020101232|nr:hypothetical protein [Pseudomonas sp. MWU12-2345]